MKPTNNPIIEYLYEYMVKNVLPVTHFPRTFNTVIAQVLLHKYNDYFLPYDRDGLNKVISTLIQYAHLNEYRELLIGFSGYSGRTTSGIAGKYSFECDNILLLELYDFLKQVDDDFTAVLTLRVENFEGSNVNGRQKCFIISVQLGGVTLVNSDGQLGFDLRAGAITRWFKICRANDYLYNLDELITSTSFGTIFHAYYD